MGDVRMHQWRMAGSCTGAHRKFGKWTKMELSSAIVVNLAYAVVSAARRLVYVRRWAHAECRVRWLSLCSSLFLKFFETFVPLRSYVGWATVLSETSSFQFLASAREGAEDQRFGVSSVEEEEYQNIHSQVSQQQTLATEHGFLWVFFVVFQWFFSGFPFRVSETDFITCRNFILTVFPLFLGKTTFNPLICPAQKKCS